MYGQRDKIRNQGKEQFLKLKKGKRGMMKGSKSYDKIQQDKDLDIFELGNLEFIVVLRKGNFNDNGDGVQDGQKLDYSSLVSEQEVRECGYMYRLFF